jgi:hypothetical protein
VAALIPATVAAARVAPSGWRDLARVERIEVEDLAAVEVLVPARVRFVADHERACDLASFGFGRG